MDDSHGDPAAGRPALEPVSGFEETLARLAANSIARRSRAPETAPPTPYGDDNRQLQPVDVPVPVGTPGGDAPTLPVPPADVPPLLGDVFSGGAAAGGGSDGSVPADAGCPADENTDPVVLVDLHLLDTRFVDQGFAHKELGPAYRIRLRNSGSGDITAPFWIILAADVGSQPTTTATYSAQQIPHLDAGAELTVDLRLPWEAMTMAIDSAGRPIPFSTLFVSLDTLNDVVETNERNNAAILRRGDIEEVAPALLGADRDSFVAGETVILLGEGLGPRAGSVVMQLADTAIPLETLGWHHLGVQVRLPAIPLHSAVDVTFTVSSHDTRVATPSLVGTLLPEGG